MIRPLALAALATVTVAMATPASAQSAVQSPGACSQMHRDANCRNHGVHGPSTARNEARRDVRRGYDRDDNAFWPGEVAADVVGGAVGTAAAIATAPFQPAYGYEDSYAYDADGGWGGNGWGGNGWGGTGWGGSYAQRNGFVCTPGTMFRGEDGRAHLCQ